MLVTETALVRDAVRVLFNGLTKAKQRTFLPTVDGIYSFIDNVDLGNKFEEIHVGTLAVGPNGMEFTPSPATKALLADEINPASPAGYPTLQETGFNMAKAVDSAPKSKDFSSLKIEPQPTPAPTADVAPTAVKAKATKVKATKTKAKIITSK